MNKNIIAKIINIMHLLLVLSIIIISLLSKNRYILYSVILLNIYIITGWIINNGCWMTILENYLNNKNLNESFIRVIIQKYTNIKFSIHTIDKIQIILYNLFLIICIYKIEKISN